MRTILVIILFSGICYGQDVIKSTYTATEIQPTKDEILLEIVLRSTADIRLALTDKTTNYDCLDKEYLISTLAVREISADNEIRRVKLGRGYSGHIYPCHIANKIDQINEAVAEVDK